MNTSVADDRAGLAEGERRKGAALAMLKEARKPLILRARRGFLRAAIESGYATADDAYAAAEIPPGVDPRFLGTVPGYFAGTRIVRRCGYTPSTRAVRHAGTNSVWELVDRDAANAWLAANPDQIAAPDAPQN